MAKKGFSNAQQRRIKATAQRLKLKSSRLDMSSKDWTDRQRIFVERYMMHGIGWRAATEAGYTGDRVQASKVAYGIMSRPHVRLFLEQVNRERSERLLITPDRIIGELAKIAFGGMQNILTVQPDGTAQVDLTHATADDLAAISEINVDSYVDGFGDAGREVKSVKVKNYSRLQALELLGKLTKFKLFAPANESGSNDIGDLISQARGRRRELMSAADNARLIEATPAAVDIASTDIGDQPSTASVPTRRNSTQRNARAVMLRD